MTDALELFDDATSTFPSKFDLKDRMVAIWVTGNSGKRQGENGKPYDYVETITLVLDDGPQGWQAQVMNFDTQQLQDNLVPSVKENGPQKLDDFQWSAGGLTARLLPRQQAKNSRPLLGRINTMPNQKKGMAPPWSISTPTPEEKAEIGKIPGLAALITEINAEAERRLNGAADVSAFD